MNNQNHQPVINALVVIGLGLIGGSLAAALKSVGACKRVIAVVRRQATADIALQKGIIDQFCFSMDEIAGELSAGDVIFIAVPTLAVKPVLMAIKEKVAKSVTITDGLSVKGDIVSEITDIYFRDKWRLDHELPEGFEELPAKFKDEPLHEQLFEIETE